MMYVLLAILLAFIARGSTSKDLEAMLAEDVMRWKEAAQGAAQAHGVPVDIILSVIAQESGGDPDARGASGEKGLMQLKPVAAEDVGLDEVPTVPGENISAGAEFLDLQDERMDSTWYDALRAYNAGERGARMDPSNGASYARDVLRRVDREVPS